MPLSPSALAELHPGQVLGHFRIIEKIGAGGMSVVYRARDEHLLRDVAVKVLQLGILADEHSRRRFHNEALALSRLNHPNIATVHEFDSQQGLDFLVMEYVCGTTLSDKLAAGSVTEVQVVALGIQLAEGLAAAHEQTVIHRDLKPGNLRLTMDGRLKILDFGLAKLLSVPDPGSATETLSETRAMVGTLPYMAPEQVLGGEIDARTDIHAAGAVLYEMATGQRAFPSLERPQLTSAVLRSSPQPVSSVNPTLSPELSRIIGKCLEHEPGDRYQSARELAIDLRHIERSATGAFPARKAEKRLLTRTVLRAAVAATLVIAAVTGIFWLKTGRADASIAVLPFADLSPNHDQQYLSDGIAEEILNSLVKVPDLKVAGRASAFQMDSKKQDVRTIGQMLNVSNILDGSIQKEGNRVRVTAKLIRATDGFYLWSKSYDRDLKGVFALEEDIAQEVTRALPGKLRPTKKPGASPASRTTDPEAFQNYLWARHFFWMYDRDSSGKALDYANRAIQLDPAHAPSYALRSRIEVWAGGLAWLNYSDEMPRGREDAERAIALDPDLPDGYYALSFMQASSENCPAGEQSLKKARALAPGDSENLSLAAMLAACQGRQEEAVRLYRQELALDPFRPMEYFHLGEILRDLHRYDEANAVFDKALELNRGVEQVHEGRGELLLAQGRAQEALSEMEKEPAGVAHELGIALAYFAVGRRAESDAALASIISQYPDTMAYQIAQVYAYRGQVEEAFHWLDHSYETHDPGLMWLKTDLKMSSLRGDSRYAQMLKKLHLSE